MANIPEKAKVAVLTGTQKIEVFSKPIPEIGDDEVLVKVEGCGICGTDVHEYKGDPFGYIPVQLGHEGTGTVVKIGKNVSKDYTGKPLGVGDKVVTGLRPCGQCDTCKHHPENVHLCDNGEIFGLMPGMDHLFNGWFGEYIKINAGGVIFNVSDMALDLRILIEPAAVIVHAVEQAKRIYTFRNDSCVLVQGCGPIGLLLLTYVRCMGVRNIIAVDMDDKRLAMAKRLGATNTVNPSAFATLEEAVAKVKEYSNGAGAECAFQCTGSPKAASAVWKYVRRGGALVELGFFVNAGDAVINPHLDICNKEIRVIGSWTYQAKDWVQSFAFLKEAQQRGLPVEEIITHKFKLDDINEAMETNIAMTGLKIAVVNE